VVPVLLGGAVVLRLFLIIGIFTGGLRGLLLPRRYLLVPAGIMALAARVPVLALSRALVPVPPVMAPPLPSLVLALLRRPRLLGLRSRRGLTVRRLLWLL